MAWGKRRRLQQAVGATGAFTILAIDHRGPLRRRLSSHWPADQVDAALASLKQDIVATLAPLSTAVLLDPETGLQPCLETGALPGQTGLLIALDTGSTGDPAKLETGLVEGWDVRRIARTGASGVKLLVYYHPDAPEARKVEATVSTVARACATEEIPFYLEPLSYSPEDPARPLTSAARRRVVVESARRLVPLGVDVLKAEFPVKVSADPDEAIWRDACRELSECCAVPWVLLSAGVPYDVFLRQAIVACESGASGVMAGRAIWDDAVTPDSSARRKFLAQVAVERMRRLQSICEARARPYPFDPPRGVPWKTQV
jgi:tagatose-1,6-bisphosphate aldolase